MSRDLWGANRRASVAGTVEELAALEAEATALIWDLSHPDADHVALVPRLAKLRDGIRAVRDSL